MKMPDAAERKVLMVTTFVSGCIALMPQEWVSAAVLLLASGLMFLGERRLAKAAMVAPLAATPELPAQVALPAEEIAMLAAEAAPRAESAAPPPHSP